MNKHDFHYKLSKYFLYLSVIIFGGLMWSVFRPLNILEVVQPYEVLNENKQVRRGETLVYKSVYRKHYGYPAVLFKNIVCNDGNLVTLASNRSNVPVGESTVFIETIVPEKTSLGTCRVEVNILYKVNPFREDNYFFVTEDFTVIE